MGGYHYWKGGDDDPRDQVGVDPTTPAAGDAEPVHPVWGYPFPAAGAPDLQHAIQAGSTADAAVRLQRIHDGLCRGAYHAQRGDLNALMSDAGALEALQATRDRLADLEVYAAELHDLLERINAAHDASDGCALCQPTGDKVRAALQVDPPARGRAILDEVQRLRAGLRALLDHHADEDAWPGSPLDIARRAALDGPAAQEEGG